MSFRMVNWKKGWILIIWNPQYFYDTILRFVYVKKHDICQKKWISSEIATLVKKTFLNYASLKLL